MVSECLESTGMRPGESITWCFCLFSCSQTIDLAGRHGAHGDLKPIHCTCFAKILILSVYVHSVNLSFLSIQDTGLAAKRMESFSWFVIYSVTLSGVLGFLVSSFEK